MNPYLSDPPGRARHNGAGSRRSPHTRPLRRFRERTPIRTGPCILIALLIAATATVSPGAALAQQGRITGRIFDDSTGQPLESANVVLVNTIYGTHSREDGVFTIPDVPPGEYTIQASYMGYQVLRRDVTVEAWRTVEEEFRLVPTVARQEREVLVTAERPLVDVRAASTTRTYTDEELKALTIDPTLDSVVEQQPGVVRDNDRIHIRGGRSEETLVIVDGVEMRDLLTGDSQGSNVSARSVAEVNIITGGFDAKYGQALSGVVEARLKEGGQRFKGYLGFTTDRLTDDRDLDLWNVELEGPLPVLGTLLRPIGAATQSRPTFYMNIGVDLENGYLPSIGHMPGRYLNSSYSESFFGSDRRYERAFYPRSRNDWRVLLKSAWKASASHKFTLSLTKSLSFDHGFSDSDISEIDRSSLNYDWRYGSLTPEGRIDYHNMGFDRYYTVTRDQNSFSMAWNHTVRPDMVHTLTATRFFSSRHQDVGGKYWYEYDIIDDDPIYGPDDPYFENWGDADRYQNRFIETWRMESEWVHKRGRHDIRWGGHAQYETVQYLRLNASSVSDVRPLGTEFDRFRVYPNTGAMYIQDRIEYEGLIVSGGLRYDYWFPGRQVERLFEENRHIIVNDETRAEWRQDTHELFGRRFKGHLSPRLQVSHPITERDHLFFNYGHFTQRPPYFYVYAKNSSQSSEEFPSIGNPNLNPEVSVQYELGAGHQFRNDMAAKASIFNKDIYDYPTGVTVELQDRVTTRSNYYLYLNRDYARSRGFELELRKRGSGRTSWAGAYSYSVVKGKSSDPNKLSAVRATGGDARETELDEEFMWWNRPHKFSAWFDYRVRRGDRNARLAGIPIPQDSQINLYYIVRSGRTYTPLDIFGSPTGPNYSKNGPLDQALNCTLRKGFRMGGRRFEFTAQGWNLLDHRTPLRVDPTTGRRYRIGEGQLENPVSAGQLAFWTNRYSDPSLRAAPRHVRLGLGVEF